MSLTEKITDELCELSQGKNCCRKAYLCGILYSAQKNGDKSHATSIYSECVASDAAALINAHFSGGERCVVVPVSRGGHRAYRLEFTSKALSGFLMALDSGKNTSISEAAGFRCAECAQSFLRGVFLSSATVSTPKDGYNLEFAVWGERRAAALYDMLGECVAAPSKIKRATRMGLYYKSNVKIADFLYFIGAHRASFDFANYSIERQIRNSENRATNCMTGNISRTVDANKRVISAIQALKQSGMFDKLPKELAYTATLRLENDVASLSELALMHNPPISKSGLNARLKKIVSVWEDS